MPSDTRPPQKVPTHFSSEQQAAAKLEEEIWDNEGGHVVASEWRVVAVPEPKCPTP